MPRQTPLYTPTLPDSHAWLARCDAERIAADSVCYFAQVEVLRAQGMPAHTDALRALEVAANAAHVAWVRYQLAREEIREGPLPFDPRERAQVREAQEGVLRKAYRMQEAARACKHAEGPARQEARIALRAAEQVHADACAELRALRLRIRAARPPRRLALDSVHNVALDSVHPEG